MTLTDIGQVWARVPTLECKGLCQHSCGPVMMSDAELAGIGIEMPDPVLAVTNVQAGGVYHCPALGTDGRCTVYERRPLICRLWGTVETMKCEFGCEPAEGWLTDAEGMELMTESLRVGGNQIYRQQRTRLKKIRHRRGVP